MEDGITCPQCGQTTVVINATGDFPFYCPGCETQLNPRGEFPTPPPPAPLTMAAVKAQITFWADAVREERGGDDTDLKRILEFLDKLET